MYILPDGFISNLTVGLSRRGIDGSDLAHGNTEGIRIQGIGKERCERIIL
jgi:hypothetical protein